MQLDDIAELLDMPENGAGAPSLDTIESTLTDGYAHALSLEAEQLRLQRRMTELAGELHDGNQEQKAEELVRVSRRMSGARSELESLRATLAQLRSRVRAARRR